MLIFSFPDSFVIANHLTQLIYVTNLYQKLVKRDFIYNRYYVEYNEINYYQ